MATRWHGLAWMMVMGMIGPVSVGKGAVAASGIFVMVLAHALLLFARTQARSAARLPSDVDCRFRRSTLSQSINSDGRNYRHTKIIATIGPATQSPEQLRKLIQSGVDVARLNMAHGDAEWVRQIVGDIRAASESVGRHIAIMMDVKGPEIRTGTVDAPIDLSVGDRVHLRCSPEDRFRSASVEDGQLCVSVNYPDLPKEVTVEQTVLVDSGLMRWTVLEVGQDQVVCQVETPGPLGSRRHINLPGVEVNLPALTEKDKTDLKVGIEVGIDFVALSFVRRAEDVLELRTFLTQHHSEARIIAKIEEQAGVRNMASIIRHADAIMVARGDLGIEIDYHRLPLVQSEMVMACQHEGKPVIIATHLLESMIQSPMPTRAEISDVCNAVREQADAVMLSGETTTGRYPLQSIEVMSNIIESVEPTVRRPLNSKIELHGPKTKMLRSAAVLAQDLGNSGIVVFTRSGFLAYVLGALRPYGVPIYAFTDVDTVFRQLLLPWGVEPFLIEFSDDPEVTIGSAMERLKRRGWVKDGNWLVFITNVLAGEKVVDSLQLRQVSC